MKPVIKTNTTLVKLYKATAPDGWTYDNYKAKCLNKGALLIIVKTSDGKVCGGFTSVGM